MNAVLYHRLWFIAGLWVLVGCVGCESLRSRSSSLAEYTTVSPSDTKLSEKARKLNVRGLRALEKGDLADAEKHFQESLEVDISFGPAHNNLGQVYLARHQLYLAAWEFEYCANLMPERVEPVINQGLAYEIAGRLAHAQTFYEQAHLAEPTNPIAISSLARIRIRQDADPAEVRFLLDELLLHDDRPPWLEWAENLRSTQYRDEGTPCDGCDEVSNEMNASPGSYEGTLGSQSILDSAAESPEGLSEFEAEGAIFPPVIQTLPEDLPPPREQTLPSVIPDTLLEAPELGNASAQNGSTPLALPPTGTEPSKISQSLRWTGFITEDSSSASAGNNVKQSSYDTSSLSQ